MNGSLDFYSLLHVKHFVRLSKKVYIKFDYCHDDGINSPASVTSVLVLNICAKEDDYSGNFSSV